MSAPPSKLDRAHVPLLKVDDLSSEFRTRSGIVRALEGIDFELRRGETMALVGESGSGKSVTAYAIMGILDAAARITSGQIVFGGLELLPAGEKEIPAEKKPANAIILLTPPLAPYPIPPGSKPIRRIPFQRRQ